MRLRKKVYDNYDKVFERRGRFENLDKQVAPLQKPWLPVDASAAILDFACGIGETLSELQAVGYTNLTGVDSAAVQIQKAREILPDAIKLHHRDGRDFLREHRNSFDLIVAYDIIEHFTKDEAVELCQEFMDALRPGGVLAAKVPNSASLVGFFGKDIDLTHLTGYSEYSLFQLFDTAGFQDHRIVKKDKSINLRLWRPWRPLTGFGLRPRLNELLHKLIYWLAGTRPPQCFDFVLEAWTHKPDVFAIPTTPVTHKQQCRRVHTERKPAISAV